MFHFSSKRPFKDRFQAGKLLGRNLKKFKGKDAVVLGIPRGGVVVAKKIADDLGLPLDVVIARKIGAPFNPELAIGATSSQGKLVLDENLITELEVSKEYLDEETKKQQVEAKSREKEFRKGRGKLKIEGKIVILVDDGIATGQTFSVACKMIRSKKPKKLVVAVPIAPKEKMEEIKKIADEIVALLTPSDFMAVGQFYQEFLPVSDNEVIKLLRG